MRMVLILLLLLISTPAFATNWVGESSCINAWLMDESSGSIIDSCGSNDLTANGDPTYSATGQFGTSITMDGNDMFSADQADITAVPMTMVGWLKPFAENANYTNIWIGDKDATNQMQGVGMSGAAANDPVAAFSFSSAAGYNEATKTDFGTGFQHWAGVWASTSSRVAYLNGVAGTAETTTVTVLNEDRTRICYSGDSTPVNYCKGDIDETAVFDVALSGTDINDIMDNGLVQAASGSAPAGINLFGTVEIY